MIGYIEGKLLDRQEDRVLVLANGIGYEILVPGIVMEHLNARAIGETVSLYIHFQQTDRQPRPILVGFTTSAEKDFYQYFISVEDIGAIRGSRALTLPVPEIARAIETGDVAGLTRMKGIGKQTARKIVATLKGKVEKFATRIPGPPGMTAGPDDIETPVLDILTGQLGHRPADAKRLVQEARTRNPSLSSPELLLEEVIKGKPE